MVRSYVWSGYEFYIEKQLRLQFLLILVVHCNENALYADYHQVLSVVLLQQVNKQTCSAIELKG